MTYYLADPIHLAVVGDDVVVLDVARDAYSCLVGGAPFIRLEPEGRVSIEDDATRLALREAGFLGSGRPRVRRSPPPLPSMAGSTAMLTRPTARERLRFIHTGLAVFGSYDRIGFSDLLVVTEPAAPDSRDTSQSDAVIRHVALFSHWLPWVPSQGTCLYRAFMLRRFLSRAGLHADWVFGVATWPFSAHCWLQVGDVLLDDDVDRVRSYTPILVV